MHSKQKSASQRSPLFLGIECGGTHSTALAVEADGKRVLQFQSGPANLYLLNDEQLRKHFSEIRHGHNGLPEIAGLAIGMAGARTDEDKQRIRRAAEKIWPGVPCYDSPRCRTG